MMKVFCENNWWLLDNTAVYDPIKSSIIDVSQGPKYVTWLNAISCVSISLKNIFIFKASAL